MDRLWVRIWLQNANFMQIRIQSIKTMIFLIFYYYLVNCACAALTAQVSKTTAGIFPHCTNVLRGDWKALLPWEQLKQAPHSPHPSLCTRCCPCSHPKLCWVFCFACSCREPALSSSGQFCKHLGLISAWAEHKPSDSTWTAATRTRFEPRRAHVFLSAWGWEVQRDLGRDFSSLHPDFFVCSTSAIEECMTTANDNLFSSLLGTQNLQSWLQAHSKP